MKLKSINISYPGNRIDDQTEKQFRQTVKDNFNIINDFIKSYTCLLTQIGTTAPVAIILNDELESPIWEYVTVGTFSFTKQGAFPANRSLPIKASAIDFNGNKLTLEWIDENHYILKTYAAADTTVLANGVLVNQEINIETYSVL